MRPAADTTAGAAVEEGRKPFGRKVPDVDGRLVDDESAAKQGYLYQIPNTFLRRCAVLGFTLVACLVTGIITAVFAPYAAALAAGAAAREFADEFGLHFYGTRRAVRIARLAFMLAWDREAVSNPDAAAARMQARADRWHK
ncbi:hypothetical protein [Phenylobacterium ferrooxidans]|uniref:DUF4231 domain-containing protein n=1 Tax=Phenylobacterium ferrooxidans TaxID=2982689 RepID=A0ABW6CJC0_9CAUL